MTIAQLHTNRAIWRTREKYRYQQWSKARYAHKLPRAARQAEVAKWLALYNEAKRKREWYDYEIAVHAKLAPVTKISAKGTNNIKRFEGFSSVIYHDSVGVPTVGYGHIEHVYPGAVWVPHQKTPGRLTEAEATELLRIDLDKHYSPAVAALKLPLTQNQFDALVSFVYNCGIGAVSNETHIGRDLRAHQWAAAANDLLQWDRAGGNVLAGLRYRREAERRLFLTK